MPTVTIGLPVYNGERFIARAIDSILGQTLTDLELIISDNRSTDSTPEICEAYASRDHRVRFVRNDVNLGAAPNFDRVLALATGRYFKWAAYDDWLEPDYLEQCIDVLEREPDVVAAWPRAKIFDEAGDLIEYYTHPAGMASPRAHERLGHWIWNQKEIGPIFGVFPIEVIRRTRGMEGYASADRTFFAEILLQGRVVEIDDYLYCMTRTTSVRQGREADWWDMRNSGAKPTFGRWTLLLRMTTTIATSSMSAGRKLQMLALNTLFFCRGWPRRSLVRELTGGARYYTARLAGAITPTSVRHTVPD